jgi:selenocysteine lyase/cysteine desulfurase
MPLDLKTIRKQFPALQRPAIFLDNPAGTQVAQSCLDRMVHYLTEHNANHGGAFTTSRLSDAVLDEAHAAVADFLNAARPEEIVFGPNMTSLTFSISRALGRLFKPGDEIVVTHLDHDANITPWTMVAEERGCKVRWVDFHREDGRLDLEDFRSALEGKPRLVAVGYASNALGTINPVEKIVKWRRRRERSFSLTLCSTPRTGRSTWCSWAAISWPVRPTSSLARTWVLYGRYELLDELRAYKVRPAPEDPPGKFETGTQNHEGIAGVLGALEYFEWIGETFGAPYAERYAPRYEGRRLRLKQAMAAIQENEYELSRTLLEVLAETPGTTVYGITDLNRLEERVPTVAFRLQGWHPRQIAEALDREDIYVWDGNYYALAVTQRLGVEESGGMVRVGPVHYNTVEEIQRFGESLMRIARSDG